MAAWVAARLPGVCEPAPQGPGAQEGVVVVERPELPPHRTPWAWAGADAPSEGGGLLRLSLRRRGGRLSLGSLRRSELKLDARINAPNGGVLCVRKVPGAAGRWDIMAARGVRWFVLRQGAQDKVFALVEGRSEALQVENSVEAFLYRMFLEARVWHHLNQGVQLEPPAQAMLEALRAARPL